MEWLRSSKFLQVVISVAALGILGWLSPFVPLKIVLAFVSVMIIAFALKEYARHMGGFIALSIVLFLIPAGISSYSEIVLQSFQNVFSLPFADRLKEVPPSKTIELKPKVILDGDFNLDLRFVNTNTISLPEELKIDILSDTVLISGGRSSRRYVIEVGIDELRELEIDAVAVSVSGDCQLSSMNVNGTSVNIKGRIVADRLAVNGTGININGELRGKSFYSDGTGVNLKGRYEFEAMRVDGTGISIDISLYGCRSFSIDGTGVNGTVTYLGPEDLYLRVDGTGGKIVLRNESKASVRAEGSGIRIVRE
ncbi:MAG: hypothetical protein ACPLVG_04775 [Pseudothermotoga sp.]